MNSASRARRIGEKEKKLCCNKSVTLLQSMSDIRDIRQRHVTSIFLLSMMLVCWITNVGAFEASVPRSTSNKVTKPSRNEDVSSSLPSSKDSSKTSLFFGFHSSSTKSTLRQRLKDKATYLLEVKNAYRIAKPSALFSVAEPSTTAGTEKSKKSVLKRLGRLLFFPLKFLLLNPLKKFAAAVIDDLDVDGTAPVMLPSILQSTAATATKTELSAATIAPVAPTASVKAVAIPGSVVDDAQSQIEEIDESATALKVELQTRMEEAASKIAAGIAPVAPSASVAVAPSDAIVQDAMVDTSAPVLTASGAKPFGDRWAVAAPGVNLTGSWELLATDEFKKEYDQYLTELSQPLFVRSAALSIIGFTTEETIQMDEGKALLIRGKNIRGIWDRTLVASGSEVGIDEFTPLHVPIMTADSELVEAETWWENEGTLHVSWLRGVAKYGGGDFESRRYLEDDGNIYVCKTTFHRKSKKSVTITWRFKRQDQSADESA